ncbi:recombinase family protein [Lentzea sp. NPDC005914]|uniref:recombinase family protein n=1 Tax=Lentzea sp. NPDC005914 TaxID=3154572 RepID=UPI0033E401C3
MPDNPHRTRHAVSYLRVASSSKDDPNAIDRQREICQSLAHTCGLTIVREYVDIGRPARLPQQSQLQLLLDDLKRLCDAAFVIVPDYARLARDLAQMDNVTQQIRAAGAEVATPSSARTAATFEQKQSESTDEEVPND